MKKVIIVEAACILLVVLWGYAAFSKLFAYEHFRFQLLGHKLLMNHASMVAWLVPAIEGGIAVLLVVPHTKKAGLYASVVLLALFTAYIIYMFVFYPHKPCACSGIISSLGWKSHIAFNLGFLAVGIIGLYGMNKKQAGVISPAPN